MCTTVLSSAMLGSSHIDSCRSMKMADDDELTTMTW